MKLTEAFESQENVFKSLSETLNRIRENQLSQHSLLEEHVQPSSWNGQHHT
jgi:peroxin-14